MLIKLNQGMKIVKSYFNRTYFLKRTQKSQREEVCER